MTREARRVAPVQRELERFGPDSVRAERGTKIVEEHVQPRQRSPLVSRGMDDQHEWYSFEDPNEDRTWVFDVTFLLSNWTCIFGDGCQGVLTGPAPELDQGCCSYGAHFRDDADYKRVQRYAKRLKPEQWQFHQVAKKKGGFAILQKNGDWRTRLVGDACIFLNRPGFAGGEGCALHSAALTAGERFIDWKPEVCWQLPIRQVDSTDENGHVTSTVREWKRRDWGEGGLEFHWWCTDAPDAFVAKEPVYITAADELRETVGDEVYKALAEHLDERRKRKTYLPHPAVRRR